VKDENDDLLADSHNILNIRVSDVRQTEMHTTEPLVPGPSPSELETDVVKLRKYKPLGSDQILARGETLWTEIHKLSSSIWNKEELANQYKESIIVPIHKKGNKTDCNNYREISLLSAPYKIVSIILI
jgi:hypothetical protein